MRVAVRSLGATRIITAVAGLSLALWIGANTTMAERHDPPAPLLAVLRAGGARNVARVR